MLEFDQIEQSDGESNLEGTGWLFGPYLDVRAASHPIYFNTYLLYGQSENTISPFDTYEDDFDTERLLFSTDISGEITSGRVTYFPTLSASWNSEEQEAYIDSIGNSIGRQKREVGQFAAGVDFESPLGDSSTGWHLTGGLSGAYNSVDGTGANAADAIAGGRGRVELGLSYDGRVGAVATLTGFYDGLGDDNYEIFGITFSYELAF